jgi:hypothetical protein
MGWLAGLLRGIDTGTGLRPGSRASALYVFLFLAFCLIGGALVLLGFDLDAVDRWLDARTDLLDAIGTLIFKAVLAVVLLLLCALTMGGGLYQLVRPPRNGDRIGWGMMIATLVIGYFCWIGLVSPL